VLQHFEETAAGDRVHTCSRLVQEFNGRVRKEGNRTAEFSLVAPAQLARLLSAELCEIQSLLDELPLELDILRAESLNSTDHIHMLVDCQLVPKEVVLCAETHSISLGLSIYIDNILTQNTSEAV
jgi:hypothetical protein